LCAGNNVADDADAELGDVLRHIDKTGLLPPLQVVQLLAENPTVPFGLVREFIIKRLSADEEKIAEDRKQIASLREDTERMLTEVHRLDTEPRVFQVRAGSCDVPILCEHRH
jgi:hypothetical protein